MSWNYSGDPSKGDIDKYRFLISDTNVNDPVLQDEEIQYLLNNYTDNDLRLYHLFDSAANIYASKAIKKKLGPMAEDSSDRLKYFTEKASFYRIRVRSMGLSLPATADVDPIFTKGMHDNVRYI